MNLGRAPSDALRPGWTDDLLVGDPRLDHQHKRFFLYALRLSIACEQDRGPDEIESALRFLREYAMAHFADEERSMREVSYPYLASHAEAHAKFIARLQALEADLASHLDKRALALDIAYMAATWFAEHVRQVDRLVARFLATADTE
jgi:hemerythrin